MARSQRRRLLEATTEIVAERGVTGAASRAIAGRAAVSPNTFYAHFENADDVIAASCASAAESLLRVLSGACEGEPEPGPRIAVALRAALSFLAAEPSPLALLGLEAAVVGARAGRQREVLLRSVGELLDTARGCTGARLGTGVHLAAAALALLGERAGAKQAEDLQRLGDELALLLS